MAIQVNPNTPTIINVDQIVNNGDNGYWKIVDNKLVHNSSVKSYIDKEYPFIQSGKTYKVTYDAEWTSCSFGIIFDGIEGEERNETDIYTETFIATGDNKKLSFWSNGEVKINSIIIEELTIFVDDELIDITDTNILENKSFTLSYSPIAKQFLSFHSYAPNNYIIKPGSLLTKRNDSQIKEFNKGNYGSYFDEDIKPFIIESIFNNNPLYTKVYDNITFNLKSELNNVPTNKFFDKMILNNEYQISGEIVLNTSNLTKKERNWMINRFLDISNDSQEPLFSKEWVDTKEQYPIDKVINDNKINYTKPWYQRARFRDKFIKVRFIENNLENQKIICNFVSTVYRISQR